ncbi:MAG TPA: FAD-linked oxidase C-terminal domain-containing protein [Gemmataceae bacterium]|nr:FAD-linked oxidase C-terminal domain-containing protein [Gemmataceae bacterium]
MTTMTVTQVPLGRLAPRGARNVDADGLAAELRTRLRGEVRFDKGSRALYATDGSNYRQVPIGVVIPRDKADVEATVESCRRFGAPLLGRGCGTSLAGQCCNVAVVMDFSKSMHRVLGIDTAGKLGTVEPGCVLDDLRGAAARHGLMYAPDPATHSHCTLGGMLGNDSCGSHSLLGAKYGRGLRTADNTHELEILTYEGVRMRVGATPPDELERVIRDGGRRGQIYQRLKEFVDRYGDAIRGGFPKLGRRVSGYNLPALLPENGFHVAQALVGSESTLVTILEATMNLVPNPKARSLLVLGYPDVYAACDHLREILALKPTALEGMDHLLFQFVKEKGDEDADIALMPPGKGFLLVEFGGDGKQDSDAQAHKCMDVLKKQKNPPHMTLLDDPKKEEMIWKVREGGLGSTAWVPGRPDSWPGWEDSAVPVEKVGPYLRDLRELFSKYGYHPALYGHFGQGCIHCRVGFDLYTAEGIAHFRAFMGEAADLVVSYGGSLSGEHGDGQARAELLPKMFSPELMEAHREFKSIWDPEWKMNPGKVIDPYPITSNLRLGPGYDPPQPETHFQFPDDRHSFARAALRCVGVGNCREHGGAVMCPSYQVTFEEKDSTRGRAHLLWEMLNGELRDEGWQSEAVKESLDLCLACKGCKGDCPVNVDMATYKAEFLSHYYQGRLRPRHAYSMGLIYWWARLAAYVPNVANFLAHAPGLRAAAKWLGGIAQEREMPAFAAETFKEWFFRREPRNQDGAPVILWADTFNNYLNPEVAKAGVEVLEAAGFRVLVPRMSLCCGRPLYDFGMLDAAAALLREVLEALRPQIRAGLPVVGLEPSCVSVFRDEMTNLFPNDEDAKKLHSQTYILSEFLHDHAPDFRPPKLDRKAVVHGHCHHRSVLGMDDEEAVLKDLGLDFQVLKDTCCGMAGSFGFEAEHYEVSQAIGEHGVLPKVRRADEGTLIVTDGFSCRQQIEQATGRKPLHLAEVMRMALHQGQVPAERRGPRLTRTETALAVGAAAVGGWLLARWLTR